MIQEALEYLISLAKPLTVQIDDRVYATEGLTPVKDPTPDPLEIHNLSGVVDYIKSGKDAAHLKPENTLIHVVSHAKVEVISELLPPFHNRAHIVRAEYKEFGFRFNQYMGREEFMIALQTSFDAKAQRAQVLDIVSQVVDAGETMISDDGISQDVQLKAGIHLKGKGTIKNPYNLAPRRSFPDINQVEAPFILRAKRSGDDFVQFALFEADGGAWKIQAIDRISKFLQSSLEGYSVIS